MEELTYIKGLSKDTVILVCKPNLFVSTKEVYEGLDLFVLMKILLI